METANDGKPATPASTVIIRIPNVWSTQPVNSNSDPADEPGEVTFKNSSIDGGANSRDTGFVSGRNLHIKIAAGKAGEGNYVVVYYQPTVPNTKGTHRIGFSGADNSIVEIEVNFAATPSGTIALTSHTPLSTKVGDADHLWNGNYLFTSEQDLGEVRFTYTAAGSMPKESKVRITLGNFTIPTDKLLRDVLTVGGAGNPEAGVEPNRSMGGSHSKSRWRDWAGESDYHSHKAA